MVFIEYTEGTFHMKSAVSYNNYIKLVFLRKIKRDIYPPPTLSAKNMNIFVVVDDSPQGFEYIVCVIQTASKFLIQFIINSVLI